MCRVRICVGMLLLLIFAKCLVMLGRGYQVRIVGKFGSLLVKYYRLPVVYFGRPVCLSLLFFTIFFFFGMFCRDNSTESPPNVMPEIGERQFKALKDLAWLHHPNRLLSDRS